jgi:hypothetical protein
MQISGNEHLTSLDVSRGSWLRRDSLQNAACDCESNIPFVLDSQRVTCVGTPSANSIAASWHGARRKKNKGV